jgi:hypothetical protein
MTWQVRAAMGLAGIAVAACEPQPTLKAAEVFHEDWSRIGHFEIDDEQTTLTTTVDLDPSRFVLEFDELLDQPSLAANVRLSSAEEALAFEVRTAPPNRSEAWGSDLLAHEVRILGPAPTGRVTLEIGEGVHSLQGRPIRFAYELVILARRDAPGAGDTSDTGAGDTGGGERR